MEEKYQPRETGKNLDRYALHAEESFSRGMQRMREARNWSQGELARQLNAAGLTEFYQATISRIEKGARPVRLGEAYVIAEVLEVDLEMLLMRDDEQQEKITIISSFDKLQQTEARIEDALTDYFFTYGIMQNVFTQYGENNVLTSKEAAVKALQKADSTELKLAIHGLHKANKGRLSAIIAQSIANAYRKSGETLPKLPDLDFSVLQSLSPESSVELAHKLNADQEISVEDLKRSIEED